MSEGDSSVRRVAVVLAVATLAASSGCMGLDLGGAGDIVNLNPAPGTTLGAEAVEQVPSDATVVDADDERLANASQIQSVLEKAGSSGDGYASLEVRGENATASVDEALRSLPRYEDASAWYVRYDGEVYRVFKLKSD
ncbi:hypothetical protein [Halomarina litorea]|uniref:hypothetical protein n=1 Tax=Halomarina litorea TaxID=2961595 RepID=UPI0020C390B9|nr:hypothetical protein [Halomarina sp. BCD28]